MNANVGTGPTFTDEFRTIWRQF